MLGHKNNVLIAFDIPENQVRAMTNALKFHVKKEMELSIELNTCKCKCTKWNIGDVNML